MRNGQPACLVVGELGRRAGITSMFHFIFSTNCSFIWRLQVFFLFKNLEPGTVKNSLVFRVILQQSSQLLKSPIQYTPILKGWTSNYYAGIEGIAIDRKMLPISINAWRMDMNTGNWGTIIDFGTSLFFFTNEAFNVIMRTLNAAITYRRVQAHFLAMEEGEIRLGFKPISPVSPNIIGNILKQNFFYTNMCTNLFLDSSCICSG